MAFPQKKSSRPALSFTAFILAGLLLMGAECPPPDGNTNGNGNTNTNENSNNNSNDNRDDGVDTSNIPDDNAIGFASALVLGAEIPGGKFFVFGDAKNVDGDVDPDYTADLPTNFQGGMTLNSAGSLFAIGDSIMIFDSRASIEAGTFDRRITNEYTNGTIAHAMDRENDRLFLGGGAPFGTPFDGDIIQLIENVSEPTLDGAVPPAHVFSSPAFNLQGIESMCIAPDGRLYVLTQEDAVGAGALLLVFANAHELEGDNVSPERTISLTEYHSDDENVNARIIDPFIDQDDNLIFAAWRNNDGTNEGGIASISNASELDGEVTGTHFLKTTDYFPQTLSVIDGTAYTATFGRVAIFNNIVGREGEAQQPDRGFTVEGLNLPTGFVVFE